MSYNKEDFKEALGFLVDESLDISQWIKIYPDSVSSGFADRHVVLYEEDSALDNMLNLPIIWVRAIINDSPSEEMYTKYGLDEKSKIMFFINPSEFDKVNIHPFYISTVKTTDRISWEDKTYNVVDVSKNLIFLGVSPVIVVGCVLAT